MKRTKAPAHYLFNNVKIALASVIPLFLFFGCEPGNKPISFDSGIKKVNHIVVIYMENHSFDNLYGEFPGANGLSNATRGHITQDSMGTPYKYLPPIPGSSSLPTNMPNDTFNIERYIRPDKETPDVTHLYYEEQLQINGGQMNRYAAYNQKSYGLTMGFYDTKALPLYPIALQYTLCDNFFHSVFGGSFLNHQWLIAAASPVYKNPKDTNMYPKRDHSGNLAGGQITPDGFVVNTSFSVNSPRPPKGYYGNDSTHLIPSQTNPTIGDSLSAHGVSWVWYSGGWDNALAGKADPNFQYHHQPFIYYKNYADGAQAKKDHLRDETEFLEAAKNGKLLSVSFVKPLGTYNEHPGYSTVKAGEDHAEELIHAILDGPNGHDTVIILTYDENGGFWDHVTPPKLDPKWGPGTRVPAIIIGPFAKRGFVDHTQYETLSIIAFIEKRWGLKPLNKSDQRANPLTNAFNFN